MARQIKAGSTDVSVVIRIVDSGDGTPETGVVYNTSGIDLEYRRDGATSTDITEATLAGLDSAHSDGGILHIGNGYYRLDLPDAAVADGVNGVLVHGTVTGMVVIGEYIELVDYNPYDGVRLGLTALPNAAADAAGGLPISDAGGLDIDTFLGRITGNVALASVLGALADGAADGDPTSADTLMQYVKQLVNVLVGTAGVVTFPAEAAPGNAVSLAEVIRAIHADVTGLDGAAMRGTDSAALASTFTGITSLAQWLGAMAGKQTPDATALTEIKATGAGSGTFSAVTDSQEAVSEAAAAVKAKTDNLPTDPADQSAVEAAITSATSPLATAAALATVDTNVDSILADTGTDGVVLANDAITAAKVAADAVTEIQAGLSTLAAADVRTAVGLASANLDTQLGDLPTAAENADAVWDEALSAHVTAGTAGQALYVVRANTAQAGAAGSITLDASASASDDFYNKALIVLTGGTGVGQARFVDDYTGSTKVALVSPNWTTTPSSDTVFMILPFGTIPGASAPTAGEVADAVWDEASAAHDSAGSFGEALNNAGTAADPWGTALPGSYGAGTAGKIVGDNLNATVGSRASQSSVDAVDDFIDTEVSAIKAKTDALPSDPADQSAVEAAITAATSPLATAAALATVDTNVDAILADTGTDGVVVAALSKTGYSLSASGIQAIWDALTSALTTVGSIGKRLVDYLTGDIFARLGAPAGASIAADIAIVDAVADSIKAKTDALPADPADQSAVEGAITVATSPLATAAALATVDTVVDAIKTKTDALPSDPADQSAVEAAITAATSPLATAAALATVDTVADTILADTAELQADWANGGRLDLLLDAILADTGTDGVVISSTTANQLADALLARNVAGGSSTGRTVSQSLYVLRNKVDGESVAGYVVVYGTDDVTEAFRMAVTTNASAEPVVSTDPTS